MSSLLPNKPAVIDVPPARSSPVSEAVPIPVPIEEPGGRPILPLPDTVVKGELNWPYLISIVGIHILALAAIWPWTFSWTGLIVMVVGVHVFGQAINLLYHRVLTHRSCVLPKWLEHLFALMALCCLQDTPAKWVAVHRYHHLHSDEHEDPHSPLVNFIWGHVGWLLVTNKRTNNIHTYQKYASDILKDPFYMRLEKSKKWTWIILVQSFLFFAVGYGLGWAIDGTGMAALQFGVSLFVWGVLVRTVVVWHITWSVNSLSHLFGYQSHDTDDHSTNNWLVALLTVGEGWHNNHHHDPASACNQHRWWEFDITYYEIKLLELFGLASKVVPPQSKRRAQARARQAERDQASS
ncbi:MAG: fatty acid desaturase [Phycisphaerales bacterium]|nr:fatty acid desaturase [Phycisphaerales bacterium]